MILWIIAIIVAFFIGVIVGASFMSMMKLNSIDDRSRDYTDLKEEIDNMYRFYNDHLLAISPDETTPESEYQFRKGMAVGIEQCLNSLGAIGEKK